MEQVLCECGCGQLRDVRDKRGRPTRYISGHQNKNKTPAQIMAASKTLKAIVAKREHPWNKGKTYIMAKRTTYANKGAWMMALKRLFRDECMRCGWAEAPCDCHHILPKSDGGKNTIENGIILCPNCHRLISINAITTEELLRLRSGANQIAPIVGFPD